MEDKTYIFEGKTTNEAIEKGLKELKVSKNKVDIKVLENEEKRSFFSILAPRVVKVEMKLKEKVENNKKETKSQEEIKKQLEDFLRVFIENLPTKELKYEIRKEKEIFYIDINGKDTGYLIGYRGEVLNSLQTILNTIANSEIKERVRIILNIGNYREKREKSLEELADKIAKTVLRTGKSITLEPMMAYERKIIHNRLQSSDKVKTHSVGEEPYRRVVIEKK